MSVQAISWVLDNSKSAGSARCVLVSIANHVGPDGSGWVYVERVLREANVSINTYHRSLRWAIESGELIRTVNAGDAKKVWSGYKPNHFVFCGLQSEDSKLSHGPSEVPNMGTPRGSQDGYPSPEAGPPNMGTPGPPQDGDPYKEPSIGAVNTEIAKAISPTTSVGESPEGEFFPTAETGIKKIRKQREPDELWDALVEVFGEAATDTRRGMYNSCLVQLRKVGATPEQILFRGREAKTRFDGSMVVSPQAMLRHWEDLGVRSHKSSTLKGNAQLGKDFYGFEYTDSDDLMEKLGAEVIRGD